MKRSAKSTYLVQSQRKKEVVKRTLATERAKVKLPYKPEHVKNQELKEAMASLA